MAGADTMRRPASAAAAALVTLLAAPSALAAGVQPHAVMPAPGAVAQASGHGTVGGVHSVGGSAGRQRRPTLAVGVNGHCPNQTPYKEPEAGEIPLSVQLAEVAALAGGGPAFYRNDFPCEIIAKGGPPAEAAVAYIVSTAAASNITVLPILFPDLSSLAPGDDNLTAVAATAERSAAACVDVFRRAGALPIVEVGQEWDNVCIFPGASGDLPTSYNATCADRMAAVYTGMARGVRFASPGTRVAVSSGGWLHYGWLELMVAKGVPFDVTSWHWYSEMGDLNHTTGPGVDVLSHVAALGKPIWVTELNRRGGSGSNLPLHQPPSEAQQAAWLAHELALLRDAAAAQPLVEAVFVYELYDQPDIGHNASLTCADAAKDPEACYGLVRVRWDEGGGGKPSSFTPDGRKPAWGVVHDWIGSVRGA